MDSALVIHRLQFAFTVTFHYIFPQFTMGLALLIVILKTIALRTGSAHYNEAARFWIKIFGINFAMGVVTGIPMEFQFGTNWAALLPRRRRRHRPDAGHGRSLLLLPRIHFPRPVPLRRKAPRPHALHWFASLMVFLGSWLSGFFIIATDAWMQHPVGYKIGPHGEILLTSFSALLSNPWIFWQYLHNMIGTVVTASFVMAAVGAFYLLRRQHEHFGRTFVRTRRRLRPPSPSFSCSSPPATARAK